MGLIGGMRDWAGAVATLRRLRARPPARVATGAGPGAPPRPAARRPEDDPALAARLTRWRSPGDDVATTPAPVMTASERAEAMRDLDSLRARLAGPQGAAIDAAVTAGAVGVRRLGPQDGHVWEMPGMRVFAIAGVQAFTVDDPVD